MSRYHVELCHRCGRLLDRTLIGATQLHPGCDPASRGTDVDHQRALRLLRSPLPDEMTTIDQAKATA